MTTTVTAMPKTATFQFRINPKVREQAEAVYAGCGLTLTDAINIFIQQSINVDGLPFVVTRKSKAAKHEQAVNRLMAEIAAGEESADGIRVFFPADISDEQHSGEIEGQNDITHDYNGFTHLSFLPFLYCTKKRVILFYFSFLPRVFRTS